MRLPICWEGEAPAELAEPANIASTKQHQSLSTEPVFHSMVVQLSRSFALPGNYSSKAAQVSADSLASSLSLILLDLPQIRGKAKPISLLLDPDEYPGSSERRGFEPATVQIVPVVTKVPMLRL